MDEYTNNWDLHAVVRGCSPNTCSLDPFHDFYASDHSFSINEEEESGNYSLFFPDLATTENVSHELEELYKPFVVRPEPQISQVPDQRPVSSTPRLKRRKNQQKKVVCQVPAEDGLCTDMWAWRKYGQKPIKGSPFPRGYYRCSSSKGCSARRQVERSRTDPTMLVITYTGDHNHPVPIHRNSLAGSTRTKFPPPPSSKDEGEQNLDMDLDLDSDDKTSNTKFGFSPTTSITGSKEKDEILMPKDDHEEEEVMNKNDPVEDEDFVNKFLCSIWQVENSAVVGSGRS